MPDWRYEIFFGFIPPSNNGGSEVRTRPSVRNTSNSVDILAERTLLSNPPTGALANAPRAQKRTALRSFNSVARASVPAGKQRW